ncbi:hypothetical protein [Monoglobus pectinilyticus]|uniref:hypothetical protein n=1 Tax=Monoglobus pectinilyticus TaxID=1981510 RepID=UPI00399C3577
MAGIIMYPSAFYTVLRKDKIHVLKLIDIDRKYLNVTLRISQKIKGLSQRSIAYEYRLNTRTASPNIIN